MQIKHLSGYAMSTVIALVDQLAKDGVIAVTRVADGEGVRGPKSTYYQLKTDYRLYFGITFNQSGIYSALVSFSGEVLAVFSEPVDLDSSGEEFLAQFQGHIQTRLKQPAGMAGVAAICVSLPGNIDQARGVLHSYTFMPSLQEVDFSGMLAELFPGIPLFVDANIAGFLGYLQWDKALMAAYPTIFLISLRSGLANGVIHQGAILTKSGEIGHMRVSDDPTPCICGRTGCLDLYLSHKRISEALTKVINARGAGAVKKYLDVSDIVGLYQRGNADCKLVVDHHFHFLLPALLDVTNVLSPDLILLTGDIFGCFTDPVAQFKSWINAQYQDTGYIRHFAETQLEYRQMGTETSAIGLCYSAIRAAFGYVVE